MTFLQLYGDALDRELGTEDRAQLFTLARRKTAVNEGQSEFARATECFERLHVTSALADNTSELDIDTSGFPGLVSLTKTGLELEKTVGTTLTYYAGEDLVRRDIPWLNRFESGWRGASKGTPSKWYVRVDGGQVILGLTPPLKVSAGETWKLRIPYIANPTDMSADGDKPFQVSGDARDDLIPWHPAIAKWAASLLESLRKNYAAAEQRRSEFGGYVADYLHKRRPRGERHIVYARSYRQEFSRGGNRALDWRRYP